VVRGCWTRTITCHHRAATTCLYHLPAARLTRIPHHLRCRAPACRTARCCARAYPARTAPRTPRCHRYACLHTPAAPCHACHHTTAAHCLRALPARLRAVPAAPHARTARTARAARTRLPPLPRDAWRYCVGSFACPRLLASTTSATYLPPTRDALPYATDARSAIAAPPWRDAQPSRHQRR